MDTVFLINYMNKIIDFMYLQELLFTQWHDQLRNSLYANHESTIHVLSSHQHNIHDPA